MPSLSKHFDCLAVLPNLLRCTLKPNSCQSFFGFGWSIKELTFYKVLFLLVVPIGEICFFMLPVATIPQQEVDIEWLSPGK